MITKRRIRRLEAVWPSGAPPIRSLREADLARLTDEERAELAAIWARHGPPRWRADGRPDFSAFSDEDLEALARLMEKVAGEAS